MKNIIKEAMQYYKKNNIPLPKKINELTKKDSERLQIFLDKVKSLVHASRFKDIKQHMLLSVLDPYSTADSIIKNVIHNYNLKLSGINESSIIKLKSLLYEDEEILGSTGVVPLSKVDKDAAQAAISGGTKDGSKPDDTISGKKVNVSVKDLRAAQTEIIPSKALSIAMGMLSSGKIGGDLGSIISQDNFIMDGHHRWAGTFLCDPNGQVQAMKIDLPGTALVTALNIITVGKFGKKGNTGKGNIAEFKGSVIGPLIDEFLANGIKGDRPQTAEEVKVSLGKVPGANGDANKGKEIMMKNADLLPKEIMPGAPPRVEMPVIGEKEVAIVQKFLEKGVVDVKPPYSPEVKKALGMESKIQNRLDNMLKESITKTKLK